MMAVNLEQELAYEKKQRQTLARCAHSYMVERDVALGRIAALEAELTAAQAAHAKSYEEAADWRRMHTELLTELAPWREMARQLESLIEAGWMPIHWQWEYPGNWIAFRDDDDRTVSGRGNTLRGAVAATYEQVGVGDE